jgi:hypothetical protein
MPGKSAPVKDEKQYEALKDKGMSKERAAKIANSPGASSHGGKKSGSGGNSSQGRDHRPEGGWAQGWQGIPLPLSVDAGRGKIGAHRCGNRADEM